MNNNKFENVGVVLLARMGASRFPGKVLKEVCGKSVLAHILDRLSQVKLVDKIVVATSTNPIDDEIEKFCKRYGVDFFRGSEENVLQRCIDAVRAYGFEHVVRLGADTPFSDWKLIDEMLSVYFAERQKGNALEFLSNTIERSYPIGLDAEVMFWRTLVRVDEETKNFSRADRKLQEINVVPYILQNLDKFNTYSYVGGRDYSHLRWTLDTPEDWVLVCKIYNELYSKNRIFLMDDILAVLEEHPDWSEINSKIVPKSGFWTAAEQRKLKARFEGV